HPIVASVMAAAATAATTRAGRGARAMRRAWTPSSESRLESPMRAASSAAVDPIGRSTRGALPEALLLVELDRARVIFHLEVLLHHLLRIKAAEGGMDFDQLLLVLEQRLRHLVDDVVRHVRGADQKDVPGQEIRRLLHADEARRGLQLGDIGARRDAAHTHYRLGGIVDGKEPDPARDTDVHFLDGRRADEVD